MTNQSEQAKGLEESDIKLFEKFEQLAKAKYPITVKEFYHSTMDLMKMGYELGQQSQTGIKQWVSEGKSLGKNNHLAPCPFCGGIEGENVLLGLRDQFFRVSCWSCGFHIEHDRKDKAIAGWNMRNGVTWLEQNLPNSTTTPKLDMVSKDKVLEMLDRLGLIIDMHDDIAAGNVIQECITKIKEI
jgi:hypothetical protein